MDKLQEAIKILWTAKLNLEVLTLADADGDAYFNMRARPWKNSPNDGFMLLVGGYALDDIYILTAAAYEGEQWKRLDWTRRISPPASPPHNVSQFPTTPATSEPENDGEPRFIPRSYNRSKGGDNEA